MKAEKDIKWGWKKVLNYESIVSQIPFLFYLALMAVVYIYNVRVSERVSFKLESLRKDVKELQWEYKNVKSEVMFRSKPSELSKALSPLGLNEQVETPYVLKDSLLDQ